MTVRLRLLLETARHIPAGQLRSRVRAIVKRNVRRIVRARFRPPAAVAVAPHEPLWKGLAAAAALRTRHVDDGRDVADGRFRFLDHEVTYSGGPDWHDASVSRLWRFHLHYFDYVRDLALLAASGERELAFGAFRELAASWMRHNQQLTGDGWHPYTISLRTVNWCHALDAFGPELEMETGFRDRFVRSLYGQVRFLASNLETDVRGNHLLKNLRALIWGGVVFEGAEASEWRVTGLRLLEQEIREQVLADGGHFERVPGYHVTVLLDVVEISEFLHRNGGAPHWLLSARDPMLDFLDAVLSAEGRLPLFKDTALTDDPHPLDLFTGKGIYSTLLFGVSAPLASRRAARPSELLEASGYAVLRSDRHHWVIDVGEPCPPYLPAHAHADLFSYELTVDGTPRVVDSGVYEYTEGKWRDYFRSTRAHNTVEVAGENQSEVWGSFRMAQRASPRDLSFTAGDEFTIVQGEHGGYLRLAVPVVHRRTFASIGDSLWVVVDDLVGGGLTRAVSRIHLAGDLHVATAGGLERKEKGWHSPRFGVLTEIPVVALEAEGPLPFRLAYALSIEPVESIVLEGERVVVMQSSGSRALVVPRVRRPSLQ